ncbi:MAG: threonine/serine dehydratase [Acidobacteria bacterium]|nr:threonine/serine dehydratase [Acidobacteriota bacterium]
MVSLHAVRAAARRIEGVARRTPLVDVTDIAGQSLLLKCENLQPMGAFKIRGAYNMIAQLSPDERARGVITYSSGNHGQAVAYAARRLGIPAVIVMPTTAPAVKVDGARELGAEVLFEGTTTLHRKARAEKEQQARGLVMVPPFDHERIIEGQGTVGLEIVEQLPEVGTVVVQVGGGGLIAGVSAAVKLLKPAVRVVGVEPAGAPKMTASRRVGHPVTLDSTTSIADGLLAVRPGELTFLHAQQFVDDVVTVDDAAIVKTTRWLVERAHLVVEPSGAVAAAAVFEGLVDGPAPVVAVISGGNVSLAMLASL